MNILFRRGLRGSEGRIGWLMLFTVFQNYFTFPGKKTITIGKGRHNIRSFSFRKVSNLATVAPCGGFWTILSPFQFIPPRSPIGSVEMKWWKGCWTMLVQIQSSHKMAHRWALLSLLLMKYSLLLFYFYKIFLNYYKFPSLCVKKADNQQLFINQRITFIYFA